MATTNLNFRDATIAAILTEVIVTPVFGLQLIRQGARTEMQSNWSLVALAVAIVFVVQLFRPWLSKPLGKLKKGLPTLPAAPASGNRWLILLVVAIAIVWPFFAGRAAVDIGTVVLIYIMLGLGLNIVVGFAGLLDLGFVGFYAVGAYTYALLSYWGGWTFWEALPLAGMMAALFGFLLGFPVLRLRGDYLAIVTLGFGEIIRLLLINLNQYTLGPDGISNLPKPSVFGMEMARTSSQEGARTFHEVMGWTFTSQDMMIYLYLTALALALITLFVSNRLVRMPVGRAWEALREDEIACRSLGLNPTRIKLSAFTLGAMFAGFGGASRRGQP